MHFFEHGQIELGAAALDGLQSPGIGEAWLGAYCSTARSPVLGAPNKASSPHSHVNDHEDGDAEWQAG